MKHVRRSCSRFRLRFGIRTLLVLVAIAAVLAATLGAWYQRVREQRIIVAQLRELDATIRYKGELYGSFSGSRGGNTATTWRERYDQWLFNRFGKDAVRNVEFVYFSGPNADAAMLLVPRLRSLEELHFGFAGSETPPGKAAWDALLRCKQIQTLRIERRGDSRLAGLSCLTGLKHLTIESGDLTASDADEIAALSQLKVLKLQLLRTSDDALQPLSKLKALEEFHLKHAGLSSTVNADGVSFIESMPNLRRLTLARMPLIDDQIMQPIATLKQLSFLNLDQSSVRGTQFSCLKDLTKLRTLNLIGTDTDDQAMGDLVKLQQLTELNIGYTNITDAGTTDIGKLARLTKLQLSGTKITDKAVSHLQGLQLEQLFINMTLVSDDGIDQLLKLTPIRSLALAKTRITPAGVARIKKTWPQVQTW